MQIQESNISNPYKQIFPSRQQKFNQNRLYLYNEFRTGLKRNRQNDTRNYYQTPQQPRVPTKRFKEDSGQTRMQKKVTIKITIT